MHSHTRNHQPCHPSLTPIHLHPVQGLPRRYLQSGGTGASAAVAWDAASETAYIVFEGTDTEADWVQDLLVSQSSDFRPTGADVFDGVGVHQGFLNQFESLTDAAPSAEENITAVVLDLSGGLIPRRVVAAGEESSLFSGGGGGSQSKEREGAELCGRALLRPAAWASAIAGSPTASWQEQAGARARLKTPSPSTTMPWTDLHT